MDEIKEGDFVTHFRDPGKIGKVLKAERDRYSDQPVWHVGWPESEYKLGIIYRSGLTKVAKAGE